MTEPKKLTRDVQQAKVGGVCAGLAEYLNVDVTLVRVITALLVIFAFPVGLIAYVVMWLVVPAKPAAAGALPPANPPAAPPSAP